MFHVDTQCFICYDKYLGRQLHGETELAEHLARFLDNGLCRRRDVIGPLVHRLAELREVVSVQNAFRFYSSSLLLLYEGDPESSSYAKVV